MVGDGAGGEMEVLGKLLGGAGCGERGEDLRAGLADDRGEPSGRGGSRPTREGVADGKGIVAVNASHRGGGKCRGSKDDGLGVVVLFWPEIGGPNQVAGNVQVALVPGQGGAHLADHGDVTVVGNGGRSLGDVGLHPVMKTGPGGGQDGVP